MARPAAAPAPIIQDLTVPIVSGLEKISHSIQLLLKDQAAEHGLSSLQVRMLLYILQAEIPVTSTMLAREFGLSRATISVALKPVVQKELVQKRADPADSRSAIIELTDWGRGIAHVAGFYQEPLRKIVALITGEEKEILLRNIEGIVGKLQEICPPE